MVHQKRLLTLLLSLHVVEEWKLTTSIPKVSKLETTIGYLEFRGQASIATIIRWLFNFSACLVSIRILGIFLSAGTNR